MLQNSSKLRKMTYTGLMTALVFVATGLIPHIPIPFSSGYVHIGDSMIFIAAILFGWKVGAIVGGIGSALADIFLGAAVWALPTLIIKAIMGAIVGFMVHEGTKVSNKTKNIISGLVAGLWFALGIYFYYLLGQIASSGDALQLVELLGLDGAEALEALIARIQPVLIIAVILIPIMVVAFSFILRKKEEKLFSLNSIVGMILGGLCMIIGYYFAEAFIVANRIVPIFSIPFNLIQFIAGILIALVTLLGLKKANIF